MILFNRKERQASAKGAKIYSEDFLCALCAFFEYFAVNYFFISFTAAT